MEFKAVKRSFNGTVRFYLSHSQDRRTRGKYSIFLGLNRHFFTELPEARKHIMQFSHRLGAQSEAEDAHLSPDQARRDAVLALPLPMHALEWLLVEMTDAFTRNCLRNQQKNGDGMVNTSLN